MVGNNPFIVRLADWAQDRDDIIHIRKTVFVIEQQVPLTLDFDGLDPDCRHVLGYAKTLSSRNGARARNCPDGEAFSGLPEKTVPSGQLPTSHPIPENIPAGTARMLADGHIGRVAVLKEYRGQRLGAALVKALIDAARGGGLPEVYLHSQEHAVAFYERLGFKTEGERFFEANIPHFTMRLYLNPG